MEEEDGIRAGAEIAYKICCSFWKGVAAIALGNRGLISRYHHWQRYRQIINVLIRNGFSFIINKLDLPGIPLYSRLARHEMPEEEELMSLPRRIVQVLRELGPSFIKLGQLLSTRADIFPEAYLQEFAKLQDNVPPIPFADVEALFCAEQGITLADLFESFNQEAIASASIGQVHQARLKNGQEVVVKVQRPGIERLIRLDLEILHDVGGLIEKRTSLGEIYKITEMVEEIGASLLEELDFTLEGRNAEIIRKNFLDDERICVPEVYWDYTTKHFLVMEYVHGFKIANRQELIRAGFDPLAIAKTLADLLIKQIYLDGFFHSDPHPGNLAVLPGNRVVFMDFGQVGRIDEELRDRITDLLLALVRHDVEGIVAVLLQIGNPRGHTNIKRMKLDISRLERKYYGLPFKEISVGTSVQELMDVAMRYSIQVPPDFFMAAKAMITLEGVIRNLAPEMSLVEIAEPFAKQIIWRRFDPRRLQKRFWGRIKSQAATLSRLPDLAVEVADKINRGQICLEIEHRNLPMATSQLRATINKLSLSIIFSSLLITGAFLLSLQKAPFLLNTSFSEIIFGLAFLFSILLILVILFWPRH